MSDYSKEKFSVYYNSACPVCNYSINKQKQKSTKRKPNWIDINNDTNSCQIINADLEFVRKKLHVANQEGEIKIGAEAVLELWRLTPSDHLKYNFFKLPIIKQAFTVCYNLFAIMLYHWNRLLKHW